VARNLFILAATLLLFALISCGMTLVGSGFQPAIPANASLWKTIGLFLALGGLIVALLGVMTNMFEQVDRRAEERRLRHRAPRRPGH
jgi:membrane protein implicated in regulation of membrane protease activity